MTTAVRKKKRGPGRPAEGPDHPLAVIRLSQNMTRSKLGSLLEMSADSIAAVEYGRCKFPVRKLSRLSEIFKLPVADLLKRLY